MLWWSVGMFVSPEIPDPEISSQYDNALGFYFEFLGTCQILIPTWKWAKGKGGSGENLVATTQSRVPLSLIHPSIISRSPGEGTAEQRNISAFIPFLHWGKWLRGVWGKGEGDCQALFGVTFLFFSHCPPIVFPCKGSSIGTSEAAGNGQKCPLLQPQHNISVPKIHVSCPGQMLGTCWMWPYFGLVSARDGTGPHSCAPTGTAGSWRDRDQLRERSRAGWGVFRK